MGWFDEQIKQRKHADDTVLDEAFIGMADAILGTNSTSFFSVSGTESVGAIEEILRFYKIRPAEVPDSVKTFGDRLEFLLQPNGIMTRSIRLEDGWYRDAVGAILAERTDDGTVAALIPRGVGGYVFYDPQKRKYVRLNRKNEHLFSRDAISFYKPFPLKKLSVGSLLRYIAEMIEPSDLVLVSAASLAVTLIGMLLPRLNSFLFGTVAAHQSIQLLIGIAVFMISISVGSLLLQTVQGMLTERITVKMNLSIHAATMMRVLSLPPSFFKQYSAGEITSRAGRMNSLCTLLVSTVLGTSLTSLFSLVYLTQIAEYAPALAVPAVTVMVVTLVFSIITTLLQMHITQKQMEIAAKESGMTYAMLTGIQKIKLAGAEKRAFARWSRLFSAHLALTYHPPLFLRVNATIGMIISLVGTLWMYTAALASEVSVADYYAFNSAYGMLSGAFMSLAGIATTAAQIRPILEMARPLMETEPEIAESKPVTERISGSIELNNVTFRYTESMPPVLNDLSLKIRAGQYIAIVGPTGCGKSTLLRILLGFEVPQGGAVYYDGRDLAAMDKKSLRRKIGVVLQNGKLFQGDIYSNIVISAPHLTVEDAWKAAELAGIAEDIRRMPMGMHTVISEGSGGISGGQKQRLMIARAIAPKPRILMFDEATSALDNITQKQVSDALASLKCTRIVIAHRLSTIRQCDRIIYLEGGRIVEDGTYDQLMELGGKFAALVERQQIGG